MTAQQFLKSNIENKNITVILKEGEIFKGFFDDYTSALDNEPDGESITVRTDNGLFELYVEDIKNIQVNN